MADRYYFMPIVGAGTADDPRRCKYADTLRTTRRVTIVDYGTEPWCLVRVRPEPDAGTHATMAADPTVTVVPLDVTQTIGAQLTTVQTRLEALNVPAAWVTSGMTYAFVLRRVAAYFLLMQRLSGLAGDYVTRLFSGGRTLDTTIGALPVAMRNQLTAAADSMGFDRTGITGATTLRVALQQLAAQYGGRVSVLEP